METTRVEPAERAAYRILSTAGFFSDNDTLYEEGAEIYFDGEPSVEMEPLNQLARQRYTEMLEKLDDLGRKTAEKLGRPWTGYRRDLSGALEIATAVQKAEMAVMNAKKEATTEKIEHDEAPMLGTKRKPGRPKKAA